MITTTDGRKIRARRGVAYVVAWTSTTGQYISLDEVHADGTRMAGPTVTAEEWHRHQGNVWVRCSGSDQVPANVHDGRPYATGTCTLCGAGVPVKANGRAWQHKRPHGLVKVAGTWVAVAR